MKHIKSDNKGLSKPDYEAGSNKLEIFKIRDKLEHDKQRQQGVVTKRQRFTFEKDLINEA